MSPAEIQTERDALLKQLRRIRQRVRKLRLSLTSQGNQEAADDAVLDLHAPILCLRDIMPDDESGPIVI